MSFAFKSITDVFVQNTTGAQRRNQNSVLHCAKYIFRKLLHFADTNTNLLEI